MKRGYLDSEKQQRAEKQQELIKRTVYLSDLKMVMESPVGRRFVYDVIFIKSRVEGLSFTGNSETFYNEGRRSVGLDLMTELQDNFPKLYMTMLSEQLTKNLEMVERTQKARMTVVEKEDEDHA